MRPDPMVKVRAMRANPKPALSPLTPKSYSLSDKIGSMKIRFAEATKSTMRPMTMRGLLKKYLKGTSFISWFGVAARSIRFGIWEAAARPKTKMIIAKVIRVQK